MAKLYKSAMKVPKLPVVAATIAMILFSTHALALRPLSADRPDVTESAYTVDAGHVQIEASFYEYTHDAESWQILPSNLKLGLTSSSDLQLVFTPYITVNNGDDGNGDLILRNKWNLWGNDAGRTAMAVMPFIKFPTNYGDTGNAYIEGGLILPFSADINEEVGIGLMVEVDVLHDDIDDAYVTEFLHTATIGSSLIGDLGGFIEFAGSFLTNEINDYNAQFNVGLTYALMEYVQLDSGARFGLTDSASTDDLLLFSGFTAKF